MKAIIYPKLGWNNVSHAAPERSTKTHRVFDCDAGPGHITGIVEVEAIIRLLIRSSPEDCRCGQLDERLCLRSPD